MDRLNQLRGEAGTSRDSTLDTTSPPSEAYMTANETSSKYFSLSEVDSTFDITPIKDVSSTVDTERTITESDRLISNLSPIGKKNDFLDSYKIGKQIEAANILSGGVDIFDDNDNSYDGDELVIDDNVECEDKNNLEMKLADSPVKEIEPTESNLVHAEPELRKDTTEVILQIDGKNVDAIDIGNGLYLYRRQGEEELAAVQIDENQQQPSYKFLKVRENDEGNLEVYEEIQIEIPKDVPVQEGSSSEASASHVPIRDISDVTSNKVTERKAKSQSETLTVTSNIEKDVNKDIDSKSEANGKLMKFCESRKSPVVGSFTPMTFHSTPNKEGIPLTKTMVDLQLHPNRHSDNVKKTIEVHTDSAKPKVDQVNKLSKECEDNSRLDKLKIDAKTDAETEQSNKNEEKVNSSPKNYMSDEVVKIDKVISSIIKNKKEEFQQLDQSENLSKEKEMENKPKSIEIISDPAVVMLKPSSEQQTSRTAATNKLHGESSEMLVVTGDANKTSEIPAKHQELQNPADKQLNDVDSNLLPKIHQISEQLPQQESNVTAPEKSNQVVLNSEVKNQISEQLTQQSEICTAKKYNEEDSNIVIITQVQDQVSKELTQQQDSKDTSTEKFYENESNPVVNLNEVTNQITNQITQEQALKVAATEELNKLDLRRIVDSDDTRQIVEPLTKQQAAENSTGKFNEVDSEISVNTNETEEKSENINSHKTGLVNEETNPSCLKNTLNTEAVPIDLKNDESCVENLCSTKKESLPSTRKDNTDSANINKAEYCIADRAYKAVEKKVEQKNTCDVSPSNTESKSDKESNKKGSIMLQENENNLAVKQDTKDATDIKIENKNAHPKQSKEFVQPVNEITDSKSHISYENISETLDDKKSTLQKEDDRKSTLQKVDKVKLMPLELKPIADSTTKTDETKLSSKIDPQIALGSVADNIRKKEISNKSSKSTLIQVAQTKDSTTSSKKSLLKVNAVAEQKPIGNNHAAVPFGKWTEANRQAFLNSIKETKVPSNSSNGKQIKNSNDLNRRDVLKKIDSHRQIHTNIPSTKVQDFGSSNRLPVKKEASVFSSKPDTQDSKLPVKSEVSILQTHSEISNKFVKHESSSKSQADSATLTVEPTAVNKKDQPQRKEINNQDLIDKTIEDLISRDLPVKSQPDSGNDVMTETLDALKSNEEFDAIEKRMNELHGFANMERSANLQSHHTGQKTIIKPDVQKLTCNKQTKIPNLLPFTNKSQRKGVKENIFDIDSDEEVIEHEPVTGDIDLIKKQATELSEKQKQISTDTSKKESIITENDFDKFVRRNSVSYENCITVNFDSNEPVVQTVVQKDTILRTYSKQEPLDHNVGPLKQDLHKQSYAAKSTALKVAVHDETNKNYHPSKVKMAYQSAMTVKRQLERPITIIEDKPVKVVYMDSCAEFIPKQLNAQGKELSPAKKQLSNLDLCNTTTSDSLDSDILEFDDVKHSSEAKSKTKHQRKQVLTPVETPELELIEPGDLGIEASPKKKRKVEDKVENGPKPVVPKKSYLLGRGATSENVVTKSQDNPIVFTNEPSNVDKFEASHISRNNTASAIDNLVKAAELLETQSETLNQASVISAHADNQQNTPVKRGRGRPRKYPLPEGAVDKTKIQTPQKKPRLSETKIVKSKDTDEDDDDDESSSDGEIIRENWTMGKINENIVCPICSKLFRSENVVFKHVKHCTGPSPNRSDSGSKSPRRFRTSQDSESKSADSKINEEIDDKESSQKEIRKKRKSRETTLKSMSYKDDDISVEGTVSKSKQDGTEHVETKKSTLSKNKILDYKTNNLICEFCGKTFRQLSYLVNHKLQHEKEEAKNHETEIKSAKSVFSCEVCKKEFRKLHHLVQHRFIHNSSSVSSAKLLRKSSAEQNENRTSKDQDMAKQSDDTSAGFRCEPCDKSFRKLHHLVEHRETHDGINRQKNPTVPAPVEKAPPPPQCEICKKTFRKLHHLIEHKEQHLETSSEKSDDKSVKSSLSTKDIIHECSLCYMVFPNEHSLNKHTIICQRKKRQSATKQNKPKELEQVDENNTKDKTDDDTENDNEVIIVATEIISDNSYVQNIPFEESRTQDHSKTDIIRPTVVENIDVSAESPNDNVITEKPKDQITIKEPENEENKVIPEILKKTEEKESLKVQETTKKKADKFAPSITKRQKRNSALPVVDDVKSMESSDDDEIRYMFNPDYKTDDNVKGKIFMNIRANKRNSLQIERPNSKDLVKRRISLQHPTKVPRLKPKLVQSKATEAPAVTKNVAKIVPIEPFTDSDDSDVKYSFPKISKSNTEETTKAKLTRKSLTEKRKSLTEKRKSLSTIAKRKSLGKTLSVKHKAKPSPIKPIKKRTAEAEHRCDCGQLFSSAALLSRHTVLAHTPPRIRRRRSPPPEVTKSKVSTTRKSSVKTDPEVRPPAPKNPEPRKSIKTSEPPKSGVTNAKVKRIAAHRGVPVPEKMKKLMEKSKK